MRQAQSQPLSSASSAMQPASSTELATVPAYAGELPAHPLLRPMEVAAALGIGKTTMYALLRAGELPVIHIGRAARIPRRAVQEWLDQKTAAEASQRHAAH